MIDQLSLPSLLAILTAICALFVITGGWLYLLVTRSHSAQVTVSGFGISVTIDTRLNDRRRTDVPSTDASK